MQRVISNNFRFRKNSNGDSAQADTKKFKYNEKFLRDSLITNMRARILAFAIFLFYFIEFGTLGLLPEKLYFVYRNVKISDFILYALIIYSMFCYKEYKDLFKSKSLRLPKLFLLYVIFEFVISFIRYEFNPLEYFFRLKGLWTSFLIFPFLLLLKRNGFGFLAKLIFPVAVISNILYILSALTGISFLGEVSIVKQRLTSDIEVYRVYGGTFFGDLFFLGMVYYWITKKFKWWQLFPAVLFAIPHILAFGRMAWAGFAFTIIFMIAINSLRKKNFRILFKQAFILAIFGLAILVAFIQVIPESGFYIEAVKTRLTQGQEDVKYGEGTYGTRVITQNASLIKLWSENDLLLGIGMHPMWVVQPESREEAVYYSAFCDVTWPGVLAAYGVIGLGICIIMQFYWIFVSFRLVRKVPDASLMGMFLILFLANLIFDVTVGFSYVFISTILWGFYFDNYYIAFFAYSYEYMKKKKLESENLV